MAKFPRRRRRLLIGAGIVLLPFAGVLVYAMWFCMRNAHVEAKWDEWTSHLVGPPSYWKPPSNGLQKFASETETFRSKSGLTIPLSGYKDEEGSVVIEPRFSACSWQFYEGLAWAHDPSDGRSGWINPDGTWAIEFDADGHSIFCGDMGGFMVIGPYGYPMYGFVNRQGEVIVPAEYRRAEWYVDGYVLVREWTWFGKHAARIRKEFGMFPGSCFEMRAMILDRNGEVVSLRSR